MFRPTQKSSWGHLLLSIAVAAPVCIVSAFAAPPMTGLESGARLLSDDELGEMRGRFAPEQLNYVGVQMLSTWQTGDNNVLGATLMLEVSFHDPNPDDMIPEREIDPDGTKLLAGWAHTCSECDAGLNIPNSIPAGLNGVIGAVQSTQISGDDNSAVNVMTVHVGDFTGESVEQAVLGPGVFDLTTDLDDLTVKDFPDGFVVTFSKDDNSIGMVLQGPGSDHQAEGLAVQGVNMGASSQLAQHIQVMGNENLIQNSLSLYLGIDESAATALALENALSTMRGWGF
jgi:hypothetical protein